MVAFWLTRPEAILCDPKNPQVNIPIPIIIRKRFSGSVSKSPTSILTIVPRKVWIEPNRFERRPMFADVSDPKK